MPVELTAYQYQSAEGWVIEPAEAQRDWMLKTIGRAALRCLPLIIANQAGWVIRSPATFKARWTGNKAEPSSLALTFPEKRDQRYQGAIKSNFGLGIVTFALPWLFRTSHGYGLWVHGPVNVVRGDAVPLQGLVETDWSPSPFTMNWKIVKSGVDVWFKRGDPICMVTPYPIALLKDVVPQIKMIQENQPLYASFLEVAEARMRAHANHDPGKGKFELAYVRGDRMEAVGAADAQHRTNLKLKPFPLQEASQET